MCNKNMYGPCNRIPPSNASRLTHMQLFGIHSKQCLSPIKRHLSYTRFHFHSLLPMAYTLWWISLLATWQCLGRFFSLFMRIAARGVPRTQKDKKANKDSKSKGSKKNSPPKLLHCFLEACSTETKSSKFLGTFYS